jgi:hypothetical protein
MATWTFKKESETTVKVVVEFKRNHSDDCAGWYVRDGEIIDRVQEDYEYYGDYGRAAEFERQLQKQSYLPRIGDEIGVDFSDAARG